MTILRLATDAMGTRFEIALGGDDARALRPAGEAALAEIDEWHDRLSLFDPGSFVSYVNRRAFEGPVALDVDLFDLLSDCLDVYRASGGAFDVTVAPLMKAFGFHDAGPERPRAEETAPIGSDAIVLDDRGRTVRFTRPVAVDLGGIGKGHAIDAAVAALREAGVDCALVHGGTSTVAAIGAPPGSDGWPVAIGDGAARRVVKLRDRALSVSAGHGREIDVAGRRLGHVMDPRTGRSSTAAHAAAVVGDSARLADAWSTALLVLGARPASMPESYEAFVSRDGRRIERCSAEAMEEEVTA